MNLFHCFLYAFVSLTFNPAETSRIPQQSPAREDREDDLKQTLMHCKSVTVFLLPNDDKGGPTSQEDLGGQNVKSSLDVPPYFGSYLGSFDAQMYNAWSPPIIPSDYSYEDPLKGAKRPVNEGYLPQNSDLDGVDFVDSSVLKDKPILKSYHSRDACVKACCDAVYDACFDHGCSRGLEKEFHRNCKRACKDEF